jgi:hypothetical protein
MKPTKLRPSTAFPVRLILGVDQFFKVMRHGAELAKLAHRKAYNDGVAKGLRGIELSAHVSRSAQALRAKDSPLSAEALAAVMLLTWSPWSRAESRSVGQTPEAMDNEILLNASRWRSVSDVPNNPFRSFSDMWTAVAAGQCYVSVPSTAFRFTRLTSTLRAEVFNAFLSWAPFLLALSSVVGAAVKLNGWLLLGIPAALFGFLHGAAPFSLIQPILYSTANDLTMSLPFRLMARISLLAYTPLAKAFLVPAIFAWMLFTERPSAAWVIASYMFSFHAIRAFRARAAIALRNAAKTSEAFFLFALSNGLCALRDKDGAFLMSPERED